MEKHSFIDLDWRNAPKTSTVKDRLLTLLQDLDENAEALMTLAMSNARGAVVLRTDEDGVAGIRRRNNPVRLLILLVMTRKMKLTHCTDQADRRLRHGLLLPALRLVQGLQPHAEPAKARESAGDRL